MQTVYVVEDDDNIREMLVYALSSAGFGVKGFGESSFFALECAKAPPSLVLLDIMLPGEDGVSILKKFRLSEKTRRLPVILLTAKGAEFDRIRGLDSGADDYITKPFSVMEVISRVRAVLRRYADEPEIRDELRTGQVVIHPGKRAVTAGGIPVTLTYKEFELLHYLMVNEGLVMSRDRLLGQVWGYDFGGESRTVDMHVKTLRQKLGECGSVIKTVRNVGYKAQSGEATP